MKSLASMLSPAVACVLLVIAASASAAGESRPASDIAMNCQDAATGSAGAYTVENNTWGSAGVQGPFRQCIGIGALQADGSVSARWTWQWPPGPSEIKAFPQLIYGQKPGHAATAGSNLPIRTDDIAAARSEWATTSTFTGTGQLTFDLWLTKDATPRDCFNCTPITHEIMIALEPYGGYGVQRNPAWDRGKVTIDGTQYRLYQADNFGTTGWRFIVLQSLVPQKAGSIDLKAVLVFLKDRKLISGAEYLASVEFGSEPVEGTGDVFVKAFKVDVR